EPRTRVRALLAAVRWRADPRHGAWPLDRERDRRDAWRPNLAGEPAGIGGAVRVHDSNRLRGSRVEGRGSRVDFTATMRNWWRPDRYHRGFPDDGSELHPIKAP